jgi:hypothetical protein
MQPRVDELAKIITDDGVVHTAVDDILALHVADFDDSTGQIIHKATGLTAKAWLETRRKDRPQWWGTYTDEQAELEASAFGAGNVTARGKLVRANPALALARAKEWGLKDLNDYSRGTPPTNTPAGEKKSNNKDRKNPWLADQWNITRQGELIKVMGLDGATRMAKAAGSYVGATKPPKAA